MHYIDQYLLVTNLREAYLEIGGHEPTPTLPEGRQGLDVRTCFTGLSEPPLPLSSWSDSDEALEFKHYESLHPRWKNAASIWYTDGGAVKTKDDGAFISSGAYCRSGEVNLRTAPCTDGPTNTIMRAELIAIYAAFYHLNTGHSDCINATDSKASMQVIYKQIHNPSGNQLSTHRVLLEALTAMLHARAAAGLHPTLLKVKSHIGIDGNEAADKLANEARDPQLCCLTFDSGNQAHHEEHWPSLITKASTPAAVPREKVAGNLSAALKQHIADMHARGLTNKSDYLG